MLSFGCSSVCCHANGKHLSILSAPLILSSFHQCVSESHYNYTQTCTHTCILSSQIHARAQTTTRTHAHSPSLVLCYPKSNHLIHSNSIGSTRLSFPHSFHITSLAHGLSFMMKLLSRQ